MKRRRVAQATDSNRLGKMVVRHVTPSTTQFVISGMEALQREFAKDDPLHRLRCRLGYGTWVVRRHVRQSARRKGAIRVSYVNRVPVGFVAFTTHQIPIGNRFEGVQSRIGTIDFLWVKPSFRRIGIGRKLIDDALCQLAKDGCDMAKADLFHFSSISIRLFQRAGFSTRHVIVSIPLGGFPTWHGRD